MIEKSNCNLKIANNALWGKLLPFAVLSVGIVCIVKGLFSPDLDCRALVIALFAIALRLLRVEIRPRGAQETLSLSIWHAAMFAGAITLGPYVAALPAVFCGSSRLIFGPKVDMALHDALYMILKPAAACAASSMIYVALGGNLLRPQGVDSMIPILAAGLAYVVITALTSQRNPAMSRAYFADWAICLSIGCALATLSAIAPTYALITPCIAAGFAVLALREPKQKAAPDPVKQQQEATSNELDTFVDSMTGLANERYLTQFLQRELARSTRSDVPLSIALFDIDDAKTLGGRSQELLDNSIIELGNRLKNGVREYDLVARHSAHRLLVVLPEASAEDAYEVIIRLHCEATSSPVDGHPLSASVGIASFPEDGGDIQELINSAHRILNHGRFNDLNCVHINHKLAETG
ncbi:MAG: GGDEF domain-containing protein [Armatimonadetes bacterium]|nr:GGDEF domain-containing protein [Armatimonadota bacterium]